MSKIAVLQLPTLSLSEARLDYYLKICKDSGANLVMLGEYILNSFFKELEAMPKSMIQKQSDEKKKSLINLAQKYDITIIAPIILVKSNNIFKTVAKISATQTKFYEQQILMPYPHWNEANFFTNKTDNLKFPTFKFEDLKFGIMFGFEAYFDVGFSYMLQKNIDVLLIPSACTFDTNKRWEELLKIRALTNNIYIVRANRIGSYKNKNDKEIWQFYGNSMVVSPFGEILQELGSDEEVMITNIDKKDLVLARKTWCLNDMARKFINQRR